MKSVLCSLLISGAYAFPWVANVDGVTTPWAEFRKDKLAKRQQPSVQCPANPNKHVPAAPITKKYPYNNARNGQQGDEKGPMLVPAKGDTAHYYKAPGKYDIRGPCPGLNTAANHNFLAHDGITTFNELVDAQQNAYNVAHDLAMLLAVLGLTLTDGDIVTQKLSIGCDATPRTSFNPALTGNEPGLDGHNKFEADTSLTRDDYFLGNGDNYSFNETLYNMMTKTTGGNFDLEGLALYRKQRYMQSRRDNPNFFFGPLSLLLFGAASFLYELFPSGTRDYKPDLFTMNYFFKKEQIPPNWTTRVSAYTNNDVTSQILQMYLLHPVLFGGATADGGFDAIDFGAIKNGKISPSISPQETSCLLYQLATGSVPSYLNGVITPTVKALAFVAEKLGPSFDNLGCPIPLS